MTSHSGSAPEILNDRQILIGVTGGVAAYKTAALVSRLVQNGADCQVVMTAAATKFVGHSTFAALSGQPVAENIFNPDAFPLGAHIELARSHELLVVAPASADFIGKAAHGLADDLLSTLYLCFAGKKLFAPAMNCEMWESPAVQRNFETLSDDQVSMIGPGTGWLSCRVEGKGRMAEPEEIFDSIVDQLKTS